MNPGRRIGTNHDAANVMKIPIDAPNMMGKFYPDPHHYTVAG